jgi:hypothetical protein
MMIVTKLICPDLCEGWIIDRKIIGDFDEIIGLCRACGKQGVEPK